MPRPLSAVKSGWQSSGGGRLARTSTSAAIIATMTAPPAANATAADDRPACVSRCEIVSLWFSLRRERPRSDPFTQPWPKAIESLPELVGVTLDRIFDDQVG